MTGILPSFAFLTWLGATASALTDFCSYPLGLESGNIPDFHFEASSSLSNHKPWDGRLNYVASWCATSTSNQYLQITFSRTMSIRKIALQGDGNSSYVTKFMLSFGYHFNHQGRVLNQPGSEEVFDGNSDPSSIKTQDLSNTSFTADQLRIEVIGYVKNPCMRVEVYGCPIVCPTGLGFEEKGTYPVTAKFQSSSNGDLSESRLNGMTSWCSQTTNFGTEYIGVDLGKIMSIIGIATQGNPQLLAWTKSFGIYYGDTLEGIAPITSNDVVQSFSGNSDQNTISVLWFNFTLETRYIRLYGLTVQNAFCMRLEVIGCPDGCVRPLGLEKMLLSPKAFQSSSAEGGLNYPALNKASGWCGTSKGPGTVGQEWISVDLADVMVVKAIATQGRDRVGEFYMKSFKIEYKVDDTGYRFVKKKNSDEVMIFTGNSNRQGTMFHYFENGGIAARFIRIRANETFGNMQCIRFELYGCPQYCWGSLGLKIGVKMPQTFQISSPNAGEEDLRMRSRLGSRGWCFTSSSTQQYVQIDFNAYQTIRGVALQGGVAFFTWMRDFVIDYSNPTQLSTLSPPFTQIGDLYHVNYFLFPSPIRARLLRVRVQATVYSRICFRWDFLGCDNDCSDKLGIQSREILDEQFTASSYVDNQSRSNFSRLNNLEGSWRPCFDQNPCAFRSSNQPDVKEYIQVCLSNLTRITGIIIQGGGESTADWAQSFGLQFAYTNTTPFYWYPDNSRYQEFNVSLGPYASEHVPLSLALDALCLRLVILEPKKQGVALRWEVLGCSQADKPGVTFPSETINVIAGNEVKVQCRGEGQIGMKMEFSVNNTVISTSAGVSIKTLPSNGFFKGQLTKELSFTANTESIGVHQGHCVPTSLFDRPDAYDCTFPLRCTVSYHSESTSVQKETVLKILGLSGSEITPTSLQFVERTSESITLTWEHPRDSFALKYYRIDVIVGGVILNTSFTKLNTANINNLMPNSFYTFNVTYVSERNQMSTPLSGTTKTDEKAPTSPILQITSFGSSFIVADWQLSVSPAWNLDHYRVLLGHYRSGQVRYFDVDKITNEKNLTGLEGYTLYVIQVQAWAKGGQLEGAWSNFSFASTLEGAPGPPSIGIGSMSNTTVNIAWTTPSPPNGIVSNYTLWFAKERFDNQTIVKNFAATVTSMAFNSLQPYTEYVAQVKAYTKGGTLEGQWSSVLRFRTSEGVPMPPSNIRIRPNATFVVILWEAPNPPLGLISSYQIEYQAANVSQPLQIGNIAYGSSSYTLAGLKPFTKYRFRMKTYSKSNTLESAWSDINTVSTLEGSPSAPRNLTTFHNASTFVFLQWETPRELNGVLHGYKIQVEGKKSYNITFELRRQYDTSHNNISFELIGGTDFIIEVSGVTGGGEGEKATAEFYVREQAPQSPRSSIASTAFGVDIVLFPALDTNGPISRHELILLKTTTGCDSLGLSLPSQDVMVIVESFSLKKIQVIRGVENVNGSSFSLPLISRSIFCYRAITVGLNLTLVGKSDSFIIERRSLPKSKDVDKDLISESSFTVELVQVANVNVSHYQVIVVELNESTINIIPDEFPPSKLGAVGNQQSAGLPYIAAEFAANKFSDYQRFVVGDRKTYSRQSRRRRETANLGVFLNAELKPQTIYGVFQRALEPNGNYYTGPWIGPVTTAQKSSAAKTSGSSNTGSIVGGVVGGIALILALFFIIYIIRKRRHGNLQDKTEQKLSSGKTGKEKSGFVRYFTPKSRETASEGVGEYGLAKVTPQNVAQSQPKISTNRKEMYEGMKGGQQNAGYFNDDDMYQSIDQPIQQGTQHAMTLPTKGAPKGSKQRFSLNAKASDVPLYENDTPSHEETRYENTSVREKHRPANDSVERQPMPIPVQSKQEKQYNQQPESGNSQRNTSKGGEPTVTQHDYEFIEPRNNVKPPNPPRQAVKSTSFTKRNLNSKLAGMEKIDRYRQNGYQSQFENLNRPAALIRADEYQYGRLPKNKKKNRCENILPKDAHRVVLEGRQERPEDDYINAIAIEGYQKDEDYIITSFPVKGTLADFWYMIQQEKCEVVVILNSLREENQKYPKATPGAGHSKQYGPIQVRCESDENIGQYSTKKLLVHRDGEPQNAFFCHLFQFLSWADHGIPHDTGSLLSMVTEIKSLQNTLDITTPMTIVCSDGAGRSGTFLSILICINKFVLKSVFDIYETVDTIRECRPQFVENVAQYKFCHDFMKEFVEFPNS